MSIKFIIFSAGALLLNAASVFAQDIADGTVLAFDRKANVIVFTDKSVWSLEKLKTALPENLQAGDRVEIKYKSNEDDGVTAIDSITILPQ